MEGSFYGWDDKANQPEPRLRLPEKLKGWLLRLSDEQIATLNSNLPPECDPRDIQVVLLKYNPEAISVLEEAGRYFEVLQTNDYSDTVVIPLPNHRFLHEEQILQAAAEMAGAIFITRREKEQIEQARRDQAIFDAYNERLMRTLEKRRRGC